MLIKPNLDLFLPMNCPLPPSLLPWIAYPHSLTERLQVKAGNTRLQVLEQRWEKPNWWDKYVLHLQCKTVLHREILMWAWNDACWYARTIIPETTYNADHLFFNRLQAESLGAMIFKEKKVRRIHLLHYPIGTQSIEYYWLTPLMHCSAPELWVRLSCFMIHDEHPFYLIETLLPGLQRYSN